MAFCWLLTAATLAATPPHRPEPHDPAEGDCGAAIGKMAGDTVDCTGVLVPPAALADLMADREWALWLASRYEIDTAILERDNARLEADLEALRRPVPMWQQPQVVLAGGVLAGVSVTLGAAWGLGQIAGE